MKEKLRLLLAAFAALAVTPVKAQVIDTSAMWTYMAGGLVSGQISGTYGTMGQPNVNNTPGGRQNGFGGWKDKDGNLWLFGGRGPCGAAAQNGSNNDLWKFDVNDKAWVWIGGSSINYSGSAWVQLFGKYGTRGTPHKDNWPGGRTGHLCLTDKDGNLWLFGGAFAWSASGGGPGGGEAAMLNDLWKYDVGSGEWTWIAGESTLSPRPVFGTKGQPDPGNKPGARYAAAGWIDDDDNVWIFGGVGYTTSGGQAGLSDVWKYSIKDDVWTWVAGSTSTGTAPVYTGLDPDPGARSNGNGWLDDNGNIWYFGGINVSARKNDLWRFDRGTLKWTFVKGDQGSNAGAEYGTRGVSHANNKPGSRYLYATFKAVDGSLWLYGGYGYFTTAGPQGYMNDLWKYDITKNEWTWMDGSSVQKADALANSDLVAGTKGTPDPNNSPGRKQVNAAWTDNDGNFWIFGGSGFGQTGTDGFQNSLWRLAPSVAAPVQPGLFTTAPATVCANTNNVTYTVPAVSGAASYDWTYTGTGVTYAATTTGPTNTFNFSASATGGKLSVRATNSGGSGPYRDTTVTISSAPAQPGNFTASTTSVCQGQNGVPYTVPAVTGATTYEWSYSAAGATFVGGTSTASATNTVNFSGSAGNGTLSVVARNSCGASAARTVAVTVSSIPAQPGNFTASSTSVCQNQNGVPYTVPAVTGATTYEWSYSAAGATFVGGTSTTSATNTVDFSGSATSGTLSVVAKNSCGNSTARTIAVTVGTAPAQPGSFLTASASVCQGQNGVPYTIPAVSGATSYTWSFSGTGATFTSGTTTTSPTNSVDFSSIATSGDISVTASNSCGTSAARNTSVSVNTPPTASVTPLGPVDLCEDDSVTLTAGAGSGYSYQWKRDGQPVGTNTANYAAKVSGNYKVVVTGTGGCKDSTSEVEVTVHNRPSGTLTPGDTAFCEGGVVTLTVLTSDTGLDYRWKNGSATIGLATANFLEINETGVYTVVLSRPQVPGGCADTTPPVTVTVYPLPTPQITWDGQTLHVESGYAGYQWSAGGQAIVGATDSTFQPSSNGGYAVTVTDANGCSATTPVYNVTLDVDDIMQVAAQVQVYPNPSDGLVHIAAPTGVDVTLHGMDGRLLQRKTDAQVIDLSGYAEGVYLLRIMTQDGALIKTERIVRKASW
jgi:hypothetical protein